MIKRRCYITGATEQARLCDVWGARSSDDHRANPYRKALGSDWGNGGALRLAVSVCITRIEGKVRFQCNRFNLEAKASQRYHARYHASAGEVTPVRVSMAEPFSNLSQQSAAHAG